MMAMNCHVAQQLLNHLQDITGDDQAQQPVKSPHPQSHSAEAHDDSVSYINKLLGWTFLLLG